MFSTDNDHITAFQTAVTLAEYQATEEGSSEVKLKCEYLGQVVKMSKRLKEYLSILPDGITAKKMWKYGMRNDDSDGEKRARKGAYSAKFSLSQFEIS
jgi:hypothetical protein